MKVVLTREQLHIVKGTVKLSDSREVLRHVRITPQFLEVTDGKVWSRVYIPENMSRERVGEGKEEPVDILLLASDLSDAQKLAKQTSKVQRVVVIESLEIGQPVQISIVEVIGNALSLERVEEYGITKSSSEVIPSVLRFPDVETAYPLDYDDEDYTIARLDARLLVNLFHATRARHIDFLIQRDSYGKSFVRVRNRDTKIVDSPAFEALVMQIRQK